MRKAICVLLIFIFVSGISSCFSLLGDGSNTFIKESANSKHSKKAILFLRQAGTTTDDSYQVSITDYNVQFDTVATGNVLTVDTDHGKANLNSKPINFNWLSDDTLEISYDKNLRTFVQERNIDAITIVYKTK